MPEGHRACLIYGLTMSHCETNLATGQTFFLRILQEIDEGSTVGNSMSMATERQGPRRETRELYRTPVREPSPKEQAADQPLPWLRQQKESRPRPYGFTRPREVGISRLLVDQRCVARGPHRRPNYPLLAVLPCAQRRSATVHVPGGLTCRLSNLRLIP